MKNDKDKKAKFFCESCGAEVPQDAKFCKNCGKFFAAVRCPKCGRTGGTSEFTNGCPECGYAVGGSHFSMPGAGATVRAAAKKKSAASKKRKASYNESGLPVWIYVVILACLVGIIIGMYSCLVQ